MLDGHNRRAIRSGELTAIINEGRDLLSVQRERLPEVVDAQSGLDRLITLQDCSIVHRGRRCCKYLLQCSCYGS
jgi:hypothetical protein